MSNNVNIRELAVEILMEVTEQGMYSHIALHRVLDKYRFLPRQERAFLTRLVNGTLERLLEMNWILNQFSKTKVSKMKPFIRCLLQMSVYQLYYMDSVPAGAVCNEAVKLAKKRGFGGLSGFVNGVLRTISRNRESLQKPDPVREPLRYLSITYSMPEWILSMWISRFGRKQTGEICAAFLEPAPLAVRVNRAKTTPDELRQKLLAEGVSVRAYDGALRLAAAKPDSGKREGSSDHPEGKDDCPVHPEGETGSPDHSKKETGCEDLQVSEETRGKETGQVSGWTPGFDAFFLSGYETIDELSAFQDGLFFVQDIASMLAVDRAGIRPGDLVLDVCAAPGGKSIHAAELAGADRDRSAETGAAAASDRVLLQEQGCMGGGNPGFVEARDLTEYKIELINENVERSGFSNIRAVKQDARIREESWIGRADVVIADLPCSGLGVPGRKPEIRYRIRPEDLDKLASLQREILSVVQEYVKPGGILLYSTCTISEKENQKNTAWFRENFPGFLQKSEEQLLPLPGVHDGFFIAVFRKKLQG